MGKNPQSRAGFTLVEVAIVLLVVTILLGYTVALFPIQQDLKKSRQAEHELDQIVEQLIAFAQVNGRLPCPDTDVGAPDGLENVEIVLMEDAVVGTAKTENETPYTPLIQANVPLYGLTEDIKARGMDPEYLSGGITPIDYGKLIDLIETSERVISWL